MSKQEIIMNNTTEKVPSNRYAVCLIFKGYQMFVDADGNTIHDSTTSRYINDYKTASAVYDNNNNCQSTKLLEYHHEGKYYMILKEKYS